MPDALVQFVSNFQKVSAEIDKAAVKQMTAACNEARNQVLQNLSGSRTGRRYRVPGTSRYYTASSPGQYPAVQIGDLKGSIRYVVVGKGTEVDGYLGTDKFHGLILEKKAPSKGGREWLRPSLVKAQPKINSILSQRWF